MSVVNLKHTREESTAIRATLLNDINRQIIVQIKPQPALLKKLGRCYYIVKIKDKDTVIVTLVSAEAALGTNRSTLQNSKLYGQHSYFGYVRYNGKKCTFMRERKVKETTTYAEGEVLFTFKLDTCGMNLRTTNIKAAFEHYRGK